MANLINTMLPEAEKNRKAVAKLMKAIKAQFDVEYIGGVGFCGPRWQEAQAAYEAACSEAAILESFARIARTRACYRCGASVGACGCVEAVA